MSELKNCPFCGKQPTVNPDDGRIYCSNESCDVYTDLPTDQWNSRPIEDKLEADLAAAREALELAEPVFDIANPQSSKKFDHDSFVKAHRARSKALARLGGK